MEELDDNQSGLQEMPSNEELEQLIQIPDPEPEQSSDAISEEDMQLMQPAPEEEQREERQPKKSDVRYRLHQERQRAYNLAQEKMMMEQQLNAERQQFAQQLNAERQARQTATEAANYFLEDSHNERIKRADAAIKSALDIGDNDAAEKARDEKTSAQIAKAESEKWRTQQQLSQQQQPDEQQYGDNFQQPEQFAPQNQGFQQNPYQMQEQMANEWVNNNAWWMNENSPSHHPELTADFNQRIRDFDQVLHQNGLQAHIGTPDYYAVVQQNIDEALERNTKPQSQKRREPQMNQVRRGVTPVRGGYGSNPNPQQRQQSMGVFQDQRAREYFNSLNRTGKDNGRWDQVKPEAFQREYEKALVKIQKRAGLI